MVIVTEDRGKDHTFPSQRWIARLKHNHRRWSMGASEREAIGALVLSYREDFDVSMNSPTPGRSDKAEPSASTITEGS